MEKLNFKKGFTLIELLVVIAIIGILTGIVLVSVTGVRNRAYDAEIKSEINQIMTRAEIHSNDNGTYTGFSIPAEYVPPVCSGSSYGIDVTSDSIAIFAPLCTNSSQYWCVDSQGFTGTKSTNPGSNADGTCN